MDEDSIRRLLGQLFIVGFDGLTANEHIKTLIQAPYYIGNVILSVNNVASTEQLIKLTCELQTIAKDAGHPRPLFIGIEQENGPDGQIELLIAAGLSGSKAVMASGSTEDATHVSSATGELLDALGINMNYYSVQYSSRSDPVANSTGRLASRIAKGFRQGNIVPCMKCVPYRIDANGINVEDLEKHTLPHYRRVLSEKIEALMISDSALSPEDDSSLPLTINKKYVATIREELQYDGLMIRDIPTEDNIQATHSVQKEAENAFTIGIDCVMIRSVQTAQLTAYEQVYDSVRKGTLSTGDISRSASRLTGLKDKFITWVSALRARSVEKLTQLRPAHSESAAEVYQKTTTPSMDFQNTLPLTSELAGDLPSTRSGQARLPIAPFEADRDTAEVTHLWHKLLPQYAVPGRTLEHILPMPNGSHFVVRVNDKVVGFVASYKNIDRPISYISVVLVDTPYQNRGVGTSLIERARSYWRQKLSSGSVVIGSSYPRFFPGMPLDIDQRVHEFFLHRGFWPEPGPTERDYTGNLQTYEAPEGVLDRATSAGITFAPLTKDKYDECMRKQHEIFGGDSVWTGAYKQLAEDGQFGQAMVAFDSATGDQVGWTMMQELGVGLTKKLALQPLVGKSSGQIGCVGTDPSARNKGVGIALITHAALDLKRRGIEHVFIDWTSLVNWYERAGFRVWREYRVMKLKEI